jgi:hypothetical protein
LAPEPALDKPALWDEAFEDGSVLHGRPADVNAFLAEYLHAAKIDAPAQRALALPVRAVPQAYSGATAESDWAHRVDAYAVSMQSVDLTVTTSGPGYVQISHPWFPSNEIRVNGVRVEPIESSLSLLVLPLAAGTSVITIGPAASSVLTLSFILSGIGFVALGILGPICGKSAGANGRDFSSA